MVDHVVDEIESLEMQQYVGCRAFPVLDEVKQAIAVTRSAFEIVFGRMTSGARRPSRQHARSSSGVKVSREVLNRAVLYVVWHQYFAVAHRATTLTYIPLSGVNTTSGLATLKDKSSRTGYKARLVWLPPGLLQNMRVAERAFSGDPQVLSVLREQYGPIFFYSPLPDDPDEMRISSRTIEQVSHTFFPFPANTPRRVMRFLLRERGIAPERVDMFLGHWRERKEPWGRWSSFDTGDYLRELRIVIPEILANLGFIAVQQ